jgi:hypothetical protein
MDHKPQALPTPEEARRAWIEDLRSGKHKQGREALHKITEEGDEFCCLGRGCVVAINQGWIEIEVESNRDSVESNRELVQYGGQWGYLPSVVRVLYGLAGRDGCFEEDSLAGLNDRGRTFAEIAAVIEAEPEGLLA